MDIMAKVVSYYLIVNLTKTVDGLLAKNDEQTAHHEQEAKREKTRERGPP